MAGSEQLHNRSAHHVSIDEIQEYYMVVSQTFGSEEEGFEFYNGYAKAKGFSVRKANVKNKGGIRSSEPKGCTCAAKKGTGP